MEDKGKIGRPSAGRKTKTEHLCVRLPQEIMDGILAIMDATGSNKTKVVSGLLMTALASKSTPVRATGANRKRVFEAILSAQSGV